MTIVKMKTTGGLFDRSVTPPEVLNIVDSNIPLEEISRTADGVWIDVNARFPPPTPALKCSVKVADVMVDDGVPKPLITSAFIKYCTLESRAINELQGADEFGVNRDYLIALSVVLSNVQNAGDPTSGPFGPFQFTATDWATFLAQGNNAASYSADDRLDSLAQVDAAALLTFDNTRKISQALTNAATGSGPYIPNSIDLFIVHMVGETAGLAALSAQRAGNGATSLLSLVQPGDAAALKKRYPKFLDVAGSDSIDAVNAGLIQAFTLMQANTPEELPPARTVSGGPAPWLTTARTEQARIAAGGAPAVMDYFAATDHHAASTKEPWCAAFVTFCLRSTANAQVIASIPAHNTARAATYKNWASPVPIGSPQIPTGAVVVLSPAEGSDSSGHVTFFVKRDPGSITLLGGNQTHTVKESTYAISKVVAIRWLDVGVSQPVAANAGPLNLSSIAAAKRPIAQMIIQQFAAAGFAAFQQAAALANAIAESDLVPTAHATQGENSVGLFQLNIAGGEGAGHTVAELIDPATNIALTIASIKKVHAFVGASNVDDAVTAFVLGFEKPADKAGQIRKRTDIAHSLLA
jgi:uncharacterized protein (TIGR02594 family)